MRRKKTTNHLHPSSNSIQMFVLSRRKLKKQVNLRTIFLTAIISLLKISTILVAQPNSQYHISHQIIHHQQQQQQQQQQPNLLKLSTTSGAQPTSSSLYQSTNDHQADDELLMTRKSPSSSLIEEFAELNGRQQQNQNQNHQDSLSVKPNQALSLIDGAANLYSDTTNFNSKNNYGDEGNMNTMNGDSFGSEAGTSDTSSSRSTSNLSPSLTSVVENHQNDNDNDEIVENSHELTDRNLFTMENHNSQLQAMHDLFERRQLHNQNRPPSSSSSSSSASLPIQSSQELSPISIGLDPSGVGPSPFSMGPSPFSVPDPPHPHSRAAMSANNNDDSPLGLSFGLNQLPHLLGFQSPPGGFEPPPPRGAPLDGPNQHLGSSVAASGDPDSGPQTSASGQKIWPKIFRFTDGRINLSDFEKQKKIRLSSKNQHNGGAENHIESAPIMFDGKQLRRKSFLILHGGIFA